ncbi:MAG: hypothetical protein RQ875_14270 [Vicingaceae bacterium]|nr:hypothetical protein [Vicingaceae bacterium]
MQINLEKNLKQNNDTNKGIYKCLGSLQILMFILGISLLSCAQNNDNKTKIEYKVNLGNKEFLVTGVPSPFKIVLDSNYYSEVYYKEKLISHNNKVGSIYLKDTLSPIIIKIYQKHIDQPVLVDTLSKELIRSFKSFPKPNVEILPCITRCNNIAAIKQMKTIRLANDFGGWVVMPGLRNYTIQIIDSTLNILNTIEVEVTNTDNTGSEGYLINDKVKKVLNEIKKGETLKFVNIKGVYPDGNFCNPKEIEILVEE